VIEPDFRGWNAEEFSPFSGRCLNVFDHNIDLDESIFADHLTAS
jgi:hypothetical protein